MSKTDQVYVISLLIWDSEIHLLLSKFEKNNGQIAITNCYILWEHCRH